MATPADSGPPNKRQKLHENEARVYDSAEDSGDDLFDEPVGTVPTLPLQTPYQPLGAAPAYSSATANGVTQPTQILDTPMAKRTDPDAVVQVAASSPLQRAQSPSSPATTPRKPAVAPPGTSFRFLPPSRPQPAAAPSFDDPPIDISSEDDIAKSRSNIKPSFTKRPNPNLKRIPQGESTVGRTLNAILGVGGPPPPAKKPAFKTNPNVPLKRPASSMARPGDDMANAYQGQRRPSQALQQQPRRPAPTTTPQTGPSRAQPAKVITAITDILDFDIRKKVDRLRGVYPNKSLTDLMHAVVTKKGNYADAVSFICEQEDATAHATVISSSDDEANKPTLPKKPTAKRAVNTSKTIGDKWGATQTTKREVVSKSISEKWSYEPNASQTRDAAPESPVVIDDDEEQAEPQVRKRRLLQKKRIIEPESSPESKHRKTTPPPLPKKRITVDSDEEPEADSGMETGAEEPAENLDLDDKVLKFFNECTTKELADISNQTEETAQLIVDQAPFKTLDQVRAVSAQPSFTTTKTGKIRKTTRKPIGDKVVDICIEMYTSMEAVDQLVEDCNELGKPIAAEMKRWGFDIFGAASKDGELAFTNLEQSGDSGLGTPSSNAADDDDGDVIVSKRSKVDFLSKPSNMAEDLVLKDYQVVGLNWLALQWSTKNSCILADDMGLGKTCQVIAFLSHLVQTGETGPHLIVVPGSTLENWLREFKMFSPNLVAKPYYGSMAERAEIRDSVQRLVAEDGLNVLVTTYDMATGRSEDTAFLRHLRPSVCVYDEAHQLKNSNSKRYKDLMRIPAKSRVLLTGTPLQNNLQELVSLLAFLMPNVFSAHTESLQYIFKNKAKTTDSSHAALLSARRIARARSMMTPFILRRKKDQVLKHMPPKITKVEQCELLPAQKEIYDGLMATQRKILADRAAGVPNPGNANNMMKLRQAAIHPLLSRHIYTDEKLRKMARTYCKANPASTPDLVYEDLEWNSDFGISQECGKAECLKKYALNNDEWMESGKVQKLVELLKKFKANGDRTLVFSQFTKVMDILESVLETVNMDFFRLDGSTPINERQDMIDEFYRDDSIPVFMLSTRSGGAGINLACANKVVIFDSSFNPQDDIQAENRAHRVGQTRAVEVIRLVTNRTIERQIYDLGQSKLQLDERVAGAGAAAAEDDEPKGKAAAASASGEKLTGAEVFGMREVERMMMEEMEKERLEGAGAAGAAGAQEGETPAEGEDLKEEFKAGLEKAGLDLSAA